MKVRVLQLDSDERPIVAAIAVDEGGLEVVCRRDELGLWEPLYGLKKERVGLSSNFSLSDEAHQALNAATGQEVENEFSS